VSQRRILEHDGEDVAPARGSFQDLVQTNQIVQSGVVSYVDLSSLDSRNITGFYEATGHFKAAWFGHDSPAKANDSFNNVSSEYAEPVCGTLLR
jgi:hypothetical protein